MRFEERYENHVTDKLVSYTMNNDHGVVTRATVNRQKIGSAYIHTLKTAVKPYILLAVVQKKRQTAMTCLAPVYKRFAIILVINQLNAQILFNYHQQMHLHKISH